MRLRQNLLSACAGTLAIAAISDPLYGAALTKPKSLPNRPNVVMFYIDDMDLDEIGCFNGRKVHTPNMDSLAAKGIRFTNAFVTASICTPSRYSFLTGGYPSHADNLKETTPKGAWPKIGWNSLITTDITLPKMLKTAGYKTGMVGKWHLSSSKPIPIAKEITDINDSIEGIMRSNYNVAIRDIKEAGFDYADAIYEKNIDGLPLPRNMKIHNQDWVTDRALEFIDQNRKDPFFLYFSSTVPHSPYGTEWVTADPLLTPAGKLTVAPKGQPSRKSAYERAKAVGIEDKWTFLTWLDDGIGAVVKRLEELGIEKETLILFMSDNGNYAKYTCYDGGAHVPAMAYWPGIIKPGQVCETVIGNIDYTATIMDLCGADKLPGAHIDGLSLRQIFEGSTLPFPRKGFMLEVAYTRGIVTNQWKYIALRFPEHITADIANGKIGKVNQEGKNGASHYNTEERYPHYFDVDQLYDRVNDPEEKKNLAFDPSYRTVLEEMQGIMKEQSKKMSVPFGEF